MMMPKDASNHLLTSCQCHFLQASIHSARINFPYMYMQLVLANCLICLSLSLFCFGYFTKHSWPLQQNCFNCSYVIKKMMFQGPMRNQVGINPLYSAEKPSLRTVWMAQSMLPWQILCDLIAAEVCVFCVDVPEAGAIFGTLL